MAGEHHAEAGLRAMSDEDLKWVASRAAALLAQRREDTASRARDRMHDRAKPPAPGQAGESMANCLVSTIWPGLYFGRCRYCTAFMLGMKRAPHCDRCEEARLWAEGAPSQPTRQESKGDGMLSARVGDLPPGDLT